MKILNALMNAKSIKNSMFELHYVTLINESLLLELNLFMLCNKTS